MFRTDYRLLTDDNPKTTKGRRRGFLTAALMLAPARTSGVANMCGHCTEGCMFSCLFTAGRGRMPTQRSARVRRTLRLLRDPYGFAEDLRRDLRCLERSADRWGMLPAARLNCTSDQAWEETHPWVFEEHPAVQFYDYTKDPARYRRFLDGRMPCDYHLTFSRSERNENLCMEFLRDGGTVAVVFDRLPTTWRGYPVRDGDLDDLRFLDTPGVVGLKAKGRATQDATGFVVRSASEMAAAAS